VPRAIKVAAAASLLQAVLAVGSAIYLVVAASSLAVDAHGRDAGLSEHGYTLLFRGIGVVMVAIAIVALLATRALVRSRRWGWWLLTALTGLDVLSAATRRTSPWSLLEAAPSLIAFIALLTPSARAYVRPAGARERWAGENMWAQDPPAYTNPDEWLSGR
jgi:hypothetical protein